MRTEFEPANMIALLNYHYMMVCINKVVLSENFFGENVNLRE